MPMNIYILYFISIFRMTKTNDVPLTCMSIMTGTRRLTPQTDQPTAQLDVRKELVKCYIWCIALCGAGT